MKKLYAFLLPCIFLSTILSAQNLYWVGPANGSFNNAANWSATSGGAGGAGVPGASNNLIFDNDALVNITNASNQVSSILVTGNKNVRLYTSVNTVMTVTSGNSTTPGLKIDAGSTLKDSTAADVIFDFVFAPSSLGTVNGTWEFEGQTPPTVGGAGFTVDPASVVNVAGTVNFKENTNNIDVGTNAQSSLHFLSGSFYLLNKDEGADVPDATYDTTSTISILGSQYFYPNFNGTAPSYGNVVINLPALTIGESLGFPNGTIIKGNLQFLNTNNQTVRILSNIGVPTLSVNHLMISGANTRVAVADEDNPLSGGSAGRLYTLSVNDFTQTDGFFSIQEDPQVTNSTILQVAGDINQTGGTFGINSTATSTGTTDLFVLELNGSTPQMISFEDNVQNKLTLKMNTTSGGTAALQTPLTVGRLDLTSGVLFTSTTAAPGNFLTVTDADAANGVKNGSTASYVEGILRRATNSVLEYRFPTGRGGIYHTISVIPTTATGSVFQAEYFNTGYSDLSVIDPPLKGVAENEYWLVGRPSGTDNAAIKLTLIAPVPRATSSHTIVVARYNGTDWQSEQGATGTFISPGNASSGTVVSQSQSVFSPSAFTFGIAGTAALPIHLESFEARKVNGGASLEWKTEELPVNFEVLRSANGSDFSKIGTVKANAGVKNYKFFDGNLLSGINYYRLRSVEMSGEVSYSKVVAVVNKENGIEITTLAPNIVRDRTKLSISSARGGKMDIIITDMSGKTWRRLGLTVAPGNSDTWLNLSDLASGMYQITGYMNGEKTSTLRLMKQ